MEFTFSTANSIRFGDGSVCSLAENLSESQSKLFVLTGSDAARYSKVLDSLSSKGFELSVQKVVGEPTVKSLQESIGSARETEADAVLAIGGGSVIDTGKAVAAMFKSEGPLIDYLEGVGIGKPLSPHSLPLTAVPTTAGTGSEVTRNSVIGVPEAGVKVSLRGPSLLPSLAIVDPELTHSLPRETAAYTGMDALIQCLEAYLSKQANPITDGLAREGLRLAAHSIRSACSEIVDTSAKARLSAAALLSGMALANSKLGSVHGFAGPLGGMIDAPHGAICASLLIPCFEANLKAMKSREPNNPALAKMDDIAALLTGNPQAKASYALAWLESLFKDLPLRRLGQFGLSDSEIESAARKSADSSSMKGNPIKLSKFELIEVLEAAL